MLTSKLGNSPFHPLEPNPISNLISNLYHSTFGNMDDCLSIIKRFWDLHQIIHNFLIKICTLLPEEKRKKKNNVIKGEEKFLYVSLYHDLY